MKLRESSEDVATEPYVARGDDANGTKCFDKKKLSAILCFKNWWRYKQPVIRPCGILPQS